MSCQSDLIRNQTWWSYYKTIIELVYRKIPYLLTTEQIRYFAQPRPIIVIIIWLAPWAGKMNRPNRALWLATRAGKMEPSCPLVTTRCIPQAKSHQKPYNKSFIYWPSLFGQDGWILASFFFCEFMDLDFVSVHKHAKKELGQYPAILTSRLVNNPYIIWIAIWCSLLPNELSSCSRSVSPRIGNMLLDTAINNYIM